MNHLQVRWLWGHFRPAQHTLDNTDRQWVLSTCAGQSRPWPLPHVPGDPPGPRPWGGRHPERHSKDRRAERSGHRQMSAVQVLGGGAAEVRRV